MSVYSGIGLPIKLQGKELSYNNILDGDCAIEAIKEFNEPIMEYELRFGEDGKWENVYQIDNPTEPKDGTCYGKFEFYGDK